MSDRYEIRTKIGSGGIGAVYRALDTTLKREVAIKRLLNQDQKLEEARKTADYLINEAGLMSKLQHPNIVSVFDVGLDDEGAYIVMEFIDGETLSQTIKRGALTLKDFCSVVEQALEALVCAQEAGMIHRDIKPSNVMVRWLPSGSFQLKILDFGLAKISEQPSLQTLDHGNSILGSIYFMSPEQLEREPLDQRTDLYSLGGLLYYTLAGLFPFRGKSAPEVMVAHLEHDVVPISEIRQDIPPSVCDFVMRLISFDRNDRPDNAAAALQQFEQAIAALPASAFKAQPMILADKKEIERKGPTLLTGTAPQLSTTTQYRPPVLQPKKSNKLLVPILLGVALLVGLGWFIMRDKTTTVPEAATAALAEPEQEQISPAPQDSDSPLIPFGAEWKYLPPNVPAPPMWFSEDFDDSDWSLGSAPLGFGDPVATDISKDAPKGDSPQMSYYFRHTFDLRSPKLDGNMHMQLVVDDGAVIFLNGKEVYRFGLPYGVIDNNTRTIRTAYLEIEKNVYDLEVGRKHLREGRNVLAVRLHQATLNSSDCSLDIQLSPTDGIADNGPDASAADYLEVIPSAQMVSADERPLWRYTFTLASPEWAKEKPAPANWASGNGIFFSKKKARLPEFLKGKEGTNWGTQNIWLQREIIFSEDDVQNKDQLAFKILHRGPATVYLGTAMAAEAFGSRNHYTICPISKIALQDLKPGKKFINVHCGNRSSEGIFDLGIIRLDKKIP